jgi:hypothetical protein
MRNAVIARLESGWTGTGEDIWPTSPREMGQGYPHECPAFMRNAVGSLGPDGVMIIGTPNHSASQHASANSQKAAGPTARKGVGAGPGHAISSAKSWGSS